MKNNENKLADVADQMQQLSEKEITVVSFLIDGFLLKNKLEAMEGEHGEIIKTADYKTARAIV